MITKASGELEEFSEGKLRNSLHSAGAEDKEIDEIIKRITTELYSGISTNDIYRLAKKMLKSRSGHMAARYQLKQAIMELGPSGYPFEKFIGELLKDQGYLVQVGEIVKGKCVNHEIDVIAEKDDQHFMIKCKYHNQQGIFSNVKIPLYVQARFKDVEAAWELIPGHSTKFHQGWVITNTRYSADAITYGNCAGLKMLGWNYPHEDGLKELIELPRSAVGPTWICPDAWIRLSERAPAPGPDQHTVVVFVVVVEPPCRGHGIGRRPVLSR